MNPTLVPGLHEPEARQALAEAVSALFERWQLATEEQQMLLGLADPAPLVRYRVGEPLEDDPQLLERVGHLLAIDRDLRTVYPDAPGFRNRWIQTPDPFFGGLSPLETVRRRGLEGLRRVRKHLKFGGE